MVRAESAALRAVDARTGARSWAVPALAARQYGLHTDGRVVIRAERADGIRTDLVARGLDDGRVRWTSGLPLATVVESPTWSR